MAGMFDALRGDVAPLFDDKERRRQLGLLTEDEQRELASGRSGVLNDYMALLPDAIPVQPGLEDEYRRFGFNVNSEMDDQGKLLSSTATDPDRLLLQADLDRRAAERARLEQEYQQRAGSTMFKIGDTLGDIGRVAISPLIYAAGDDFADYDPSARLAKSYRERIAELDATSMEDAKKYRNARQGRIEKLADAIQDPTGMMNEYEYAKRNGYSGTFEQFINVRRSNIPADIQSMSYYLSMKDGPDKDLFREMLARSNFGTMGDVTFRADATGRTTFLNPDGSYGNNQSKIQKQLSTQQADKAAGIRFSENYADADSEFDLSAPQAILNVRNQIRALNDIEQKILDGTLDTTGFIEGTFTPYLDDEAAALQVSTIESALLSLQRVNLAPVTEKELELISNLWPTVRKDPQANLGTIRAAREILERAQAEMDQKYAYFRQNKSLKGYSSVVDIPPPPAGFQPLPGAVR